MWPSWIQSLASPMIVEPTHSNNWMLSWVTTEHCPPTMAQKPKEVNKQNQLWEVSLSSVGLNTLYHRHSPLLFCPLIFLCFLLLTHRSHLSSWAVIIPASGPLPWLKCSACILPHPTPPPKDQPWRSSGSKISDAAAENLTGFHKHRFLTVSSQARSQLQGWREE